MQIQIQIQIQIQTGDFFWPDLKILENVCTVEQKQKNRKSCAPNLDGIAVKIKRSLQGSPVENTHKSVV